MFDTEQISSLKILIGYVLGNDWLMSSFHFQTLSTMLNKMAISKFWFVVFGELMGVWVGVLMPLNHFWPIKKALTLSISNRMSLYRSFYENKLSYQNSYQMYFGKILSLGGVSSLRSLSILKEHWKFWLSIQWAPPQLIWSLFCMNLITAEDVTYNPCPGGCGGGVCHSQRENLLTLNYFELNGYLKILIECFWRNDVRGRKASCHTITFAC